MYLCIYANPLNAHLSEAFILIYHENCRNESMFQTKQFPFKIYDYLKFKLK